MSRLFDGLVTASIRKINLANARNEAFCARRRRRLQMAKPGGKVAAGRNFGKTKAWER
jgi:hypothetical protein